MPTLLADGLKIFYDTITNNLRHQDYERVIKVAEDFTIYATGNNIEKKLLQFNGRETWEEFQQRILITKVNTPDIFASCVKPLYKVGRTPAAIVVNWGNDVQKNEQNKKELFDVGKNFWGKKDVTKYITQRCADMEATDPNSFVIVTFEGEVIPTDESTKADPYPFEANSAEAINFSYENNDLMWLIVLNAMVYQDAKGKDNIGEKYYMYLDNESIVATQISKDTVATYVSQGYIQIIDLATPLLPGTQYIFSTGTKSKNNGRFFIINIFEHKTGFVPAKRVGCTYDPFTRNRTCIPLIFAAQPYFEKSIQAMSEMDLTLRCHVWPKIFVYSDPCPGEPMQDGRYISCNNGYQPDGRTICNACKGSGYKGHTSSQSVIQVRMPKALGEMVSLENMMAVKAPPIELINFQKTFGFEDIRRYACRAVYNSDVFSQDQIQQTATAKVIDLDAVYDTLIPYADSWSEMFVFIYRTIAALRDLSQGMEIVHEFPKDFKMASVSQLLLDLTAASKSGAPSHIIKSITRDISNKMYADQPQKILVIDTKDKFFPFAGKTETEVNFILANDLTTMYNKILYAHFDLIFAEIESEQAAQQKDFYQMDEKLQRQLIDEKVAEITTELENDNATSAAIAFKNAPAIQNPIDTPPVVAPGTQNPVVPPVTANG